MNQTATAPATEIVTIRQGRGTSDYFLIIQPVPGTGLKINQVINCLNPKTNKIVMAEVTGECFTFDWKEPPKCVIRLQWGVDAGLLRTVLIASDPAYEKEWAMAIEVKEI